jgi:hypothetical protein
LQFWKSESADAARDHEGLAFRANGTIKLMPPGRGVTMESNPGRCRRAPGDFFDGPTIELEIVEVTDEVLRLKWLGP